MSGSADAGSPFSARVVAILIAVAVVSFGAIMVLAGWAPELRDRNQAGDHPYSTSALGYNGFIRLLEAQDYPVRISRLERDLERRDWGLMVVTLPANSRFEALAEQDFQYPALVVLPKWYGMTDAYNPSRQADTRFVDARRLNDNLRVVYPDVEILRVAIPEEIDTPFGALPVTPDVRLQLIQSRSLETIAGTESGALIAYDPTRGIYLLSDPDMINTFGLARIDNALFATRMVDYLRTSENEPVIFDATLHGFQRSENLLKMLFSVPFLGATLVALASALLLGWAAVVRFGPPAREARAIALGKQALADNSAGLVTMARREVRMAPGYAGLIRRRLAQALGLPRGTPESQLTDMFDRLGPAEKDGPVFSELEAGLKGQTHSRDDLVQKAREMHHWRREIIRRTMHERR
ncbi:MAG: hypothetical protein ACK4MQ_09945 [Hyphomonas sp.]